MALSYRSVRRRRPLNTRDPLARRLAGFWIGLPGKGGGGKLIDSSLRRKHSTGWSGTPRWVRLADGLLGAATGDSGSYVTLGNGLLAGNAATVAGVSRAMNPTSGYQALFGAYTSDSNAFDMFVHQEGGAASLGGGNYSNWARATSPGIVQGELFFWALTSSGSVTQLYFNGRPVGSTGTTNWTSYASQDYKLGDRSGFSFIGETGWVGLWGRDLQARGIQRLYQEWRRGFPDLLRRVRPWAYVGDAGGGAPAATPYVVGGGVGGSGCVLGA